MKVYSRFATFLKYCLPCLCTMALGYFSPVGAQTTELGLDDFYIAGETVRTGDECFRLTEDYDWSSGSIWYRNPIDLSGSFNMELKMMFGCEDVSGADGVVFVFTPHGGITGRRGEGMGFSGLRPSLGIEVDTWENDHLADPAEDHVAIMQDGQVHHYYSLSGPNIIPNVEDCLLHEFDIRWDHTTQNLSVHLDGRRIISYSGDIVNDIFLGEPKVFWGVTAATGRYNNRHEICFEKLEFSLPLTEMVFDQETQTRLLRHEVMTLKNLKFNPGRTEFEEESLPDLHRLINLLKANPGLELALEGHTDSQGGEHANQSLSLARANSVAKYLMSKGISAKRIHAKGYGERYPVADNNTPDGREKNRRIDFYIFQPRT